MKIIKDTFKRVAEGIVDAFSLVFGTACNLLAVLIFSLVLNYVPAWIVLIAIIIVLLVIVYFTYKDELDSIKELDD